ncbi:class I poly(R)-hydroxyalkanoic acid synthase [Lutimaribacter sp. EGI FJ00015]|uniref:Class I poly(R)-hydroxyalkanoic acid synthase n=1 Tax=Lutimaribacter degradans TaxID=2945989 RepID=A0ACC5ZSX4_9RHOB|nr:class I poly(R)-hydroxyalkanoic acid synthase [Lutimaribacter sp. EGI FJ00013]MCM2561443.1 class I poly(R)-hydroxyalkanoic acid synthase [Lutimaribacter sp. EGI FJ00013]MCO0612847.1 class I poly(R)-hydroxyalkanoic acid synthase [Lutimaribacter sp. EGI FJ00015]MCO0635505.1 class I poly(R)-hydroxyalkanoic acid synthase [Lutimaribacter sp. EGI FJ00014]
MTTKDDVADKATAENLERLNSNLAKVEELSQRLVAAVSRRNQANPTLNAPGSDLLVKATQSYWQEIMQNPARIFESQVEYWGKSVKHFLEAQQALAQGKLEAPEDETPSDRRFANPLWQKHPYFNYVKQQYMLNAQAIRDAVSAADDLEPKERRRLEYFSNQIIDMMAPTNFLPTNPDALERAIETDGDSLVKGLENLVSDLEANNGEMLVRLSDENAFRLGENIATTPGQVVYRNRMMELIQFSPATDQVHATPLVIFPPWINKYYILDLKEQNSLIKWITEQGFTLFVVSWVNPDATYRDVGMEDYIEDGYLAAFREIKTITGQKQVNAVGYCIAGSTLSMVLALLKRRGDKSVKSATFFTTLTDFSDQGEFTPFLQDDFIDGIEQEVREQGYLRSFILSRTFSFLRSNDLIYGPAIRSYMLGETPPAFDLLYWNGDGTNLPGRMAVEYLRGLCQRNEFVEGGIEMCHERLAVEDVELPCCFVASENDHIAPWKDSYRGAQKFGSKDRTFIVAQSGHIAGIVNPPSKKKYGHYTNTDMTLSADDWLDGAKFHGGSWWPRWGKWLARRSGKMVPAREPGDSTHPPLCPAPGTYVRRSENR